MGSELPEKDPRAQVEAPAASRRPSWASGSMKERLALPKMERGHGPMPGEFSPEQQEVIEGLFEGALRGELPRYRALKPQEVERLTERHLAMVMMRAAGYHQRVVAKAFGASDTAVHFTLNHPDAEYLLARLQAMKASQPTDIGKRLQELAGPAMDALESVFLDDDEDSIKVAMKKAPLAFKVLEMGGHGAPKKLEGEVKHTHVLDASPKQMGEIVRALRETRQIQDVAYVEVTSEEEMKALLSGTSTEAAAEGDGAVGPAAPNPPSGEEL